MRLLLLYFAICLLELQTILCANSITGLGGGCASQCTCKWRGGKQTADCALKKLKELPKDLPPEIQVLDANDNELNDLPAELFSNLKLTNLQKLHLQNCKIRKVYAKTFYGLTNLVELDLSFNKLTAVPSPSLIDVPFLRELSLSYNLFNRVESGAFEYARYLVKLDLTGCQISELAADSFRGLEVLESLKLSKNRLSTFFPDTFKPLTKVTSVELHENPWTCDCQLREMKSWLVKQNLPTPISPICRSPESLSGKSFSDMEIDDFACRPILLLVSRYAEATVGENASIVCTVSAIPPAKLKWLWNGRQLSNYSIFGVHQRVIIYESGTFRKKSTFVLTNAQESDSSEFFCIAENQAGSVEANFTLHVSLKADGVSTLGSGQIAGISAALLILIVAILLTIVALFAKIRQEPTKVLKVPTTTVANQNADAMTNNTTRATAVMELPQASSHYIHYQESFRQVPPSPAPSNKILREEEILQNETSVDNPDLIRHARARLLLSKCLAWEVDKDQESSVVRTNEESISDCTLSSINDTSSASAKQLRVWRRTAAPVLPPVSALKRVLGSTRSSPDEGYQEGTATDV